MSDLAGIADLQNRDTYNVFNDKAIKNLFVVYGLGGVASHVLYQLLFRIENLEHPTDILLFDDGDVENIDVKTGLYISEDLGKKRIDVVQKRYGRLFSSNIMAGIHPEALNESTQGLIKNTAVYMLDFKPKGSKDADKFFNACMEDANKELLRDKEFKPSVYFVRAYNRGETGYLRAKLCGKYGETVGHMNVDRGEAKKQSAAEISTRNHMLAQSVFNYLNLVMTPSLTINYVAETGNFLSGEVKKEYIKKQRETIFHKLRVLHLVSHYGEDDLVHFDDQWNKVYSQADDIGRRIKQGMSRTGDFSHNDHLYYVQSLAGLWRTRLKIKSKDSEIVDDERKRVDLLLAVFSGLNQQASIYFITAIKIAEDSGWGLLV